eukprot:scaffold103_cov116-Cylindrotheca_fusiformis.AAC.3
MEHIVVVHYDLGEKVPRIRVPQTLIQGRHLDSCSCGTCSLRAIVVVVSLRQKQDIQRRDLLFSNTAFDIHKYQEHGDRSAAELFSCDSAQTKRLDTMTTRKWKATQQGIRVNPSKKPILCLSWSTDIRIGKSGRKLQYFASCSDNKVSIHEVEMGVPRPKCRSRVEHSRPLSKRIESVIQ